MRRLGYVIWFVASLDRSVEFYRDVVGLDVRLEGDGYVEFALDNIKFALFERAKLPELIGGGGGQPPCGEIAFVVDDVDAEAERCRAAGVEILTGPVDRPWRQRTVHIADPDGNIVEFAQNLPR
jgi:lactoylglutathione lyase